MVLVMKPYANILSEYKLNDVAEYIQTLRK